jgi:Coenzyme PQQ synthesis protein D (PqqD)
MYRVMVPDATCFGKRSPNVQATMSGSSAIMRARRQVCADLAGEVVILDLGSGIYFGLDAVGARIWDLLQEPKTVNEVRDALLAEYEVQAERCERELLALLEQLAERGLIEIQD